MKAYIETYGCTLNKADTNTIKGILRQCNATLVSQPEKADFIFINTCAVKAQTESRMLHRIKKLDTLKGTLVVCGCLPRINWKELRKATSAIVVDTNSLQDIPLILNGRRGIFMSQEHANKLELPTSASGLIVPIPICEGCLGACAFCGTRNARGVLTSYPVNDIKKALECAVSQGAKEIQLTAQDCGAYGKDIGSSLPRLLKQLIKVDGDYRMRIGMASPHHVYESLQELLGVFEDDRIYKFVHMPVQSGSNKVLKLMLRKHSTIEFIECAKAFRKQFLFCTIATDIIAGFPGETDKDFRQTIELISSTKPDVVNISKFFPRPNTLASNMKQTPTQVTKQRSSELARLCNQVSLANNKMLEGKEFLATVLEHGRKGGFIARPYNYKHLVLEKAVLGKGYAVRAMKAFPTYLTAKTM